MKKKFGWSYLVSIFWKDLKKGKQEVFCHHRWELTEVVFPSTKRLNQPNHSSMDEWRKCGIHRLHCIGYHARLEMWSVHIMECYSAMKGMKYMFQHQWTLKTLFQIKEANHKRLHNTWSIDRKHRRRKWKDDPQWLEEEGTESCLQHEQFAGPILEGQISFGIL